MAVTITVSDSSWAQFNEARNDYQSYQADPYTSGSQEDTDCLLERLIELADKADALIRSASVGR
jgi:hypothetical protein